MSTTEEKRVPLAAFVDSEQRRALTELAHKEDRSVSSIVRLALGGYLDRATRSGATRSGAATDATSAPPRGADR